MRYDCLYACVDKKCLVSLYFHHLVKHSGHSDFFTSKMSKEELVSEVVNYV